MQTVSSAAVRAPRGFARRLLRRLDEAQDRTRLNNLSDHMLRDIGLTRDGIDDALRGARAR